MKNDSTPSGSSEAMPNPSSASQRFTGGWLDGTLVLFEPSRELLYVHTEGAGKKVAVHWKPDTQFVMDGLPASTASLRLGQRVHIHCRMARHELSADHIAMEPLPASKPATTAPQAQWRPPRGEGNR